MKLWRAMPGQLDFAEVPDRLLLFVYGLLAFPANPGPALLHSTPLCGVVVRLEVCESVRGAPWSLYSRGLEPGFARCFLLNLLILFICFLFTPSLDRLEAVFQMLHTRQPDLFCLIFQFLASLRSALSATTWPTFFSLTSTPSASDQEHEVFPDQYQH